MAPKATWPVLAIVVLVTALTPSAASARPLIQIIETGRGVSGPTLQIVGDTTNEQIVVAQADEGGNRRITVETASATVGPRCEAVSPTLTRCATGDVVAISAFLSEGTIDPTPTTESNSIDVTRVTQAAPDGAPLRIQLSGGPGPDRIVDGASGSSIGGGSGDDSITAGAGNDDIDDGRGNDAILAGEGDDRFGDFATQESDILSGGPGRDSVNARGTVTLNDLFCNDGSLADAPSSPTGVPRSVAAPEGRLECSGTAADRDLIAGVESVGQVNSNEPVDFTGTTVDELLLGQNGADRFEGGGGADSVLGSGGNDRLLMRDGGADARTDCGDGAEDRAVTDQEDPVESNCETIERGRANLAGPIGGGAGVPGVAPPSPPQGNQPSGSNEGNGAGGGDNGATPPEVEIPTPVAFVRRNRIQIRVRCVYRAQNCVGRLTLTAAQNKRVGKRRVRKGQRLASGAVNVPWGTSKATTLRSPASLTSLLRSLRGRTLKVRALVQVRDGAAPRTARNARASRVVTLGLQR